MRENELFLRITTEAFGNFSVYNKQEKEIPTCLFQIVTMREGKFSFTSMIITIIIIQSFTYPPHKYRTKI